MNTKPVLLCDMDGPIADFDTAYWRACAKRGIQLNCTQETQKVRFLADAAASKTDADLMQNIVEAKHFFYDLPVTPGAREGLDALAEVFEVWICSKPLETNPFCRDEKAAWIEYNLGWKWVDRLILAGDKSLVVGSILLDDAPKPKWYSRAIWQPVIFPTPWNDTGSIWEGLPRWTWGQSIESLLAYGLHERPDMAPGGTDFEDIPFDLFQNA